VTDQQFQQCGAVRREGYDVLRCGRAAGHPADGPGRGHGDWRVFGAVTDPDGPTGRILDALWEQISQEDPDAWQAPDTGQRSVAPDADMPTGVEATGYRVTGRGERPGQRIDIEIHQSRGEGMSGPAGELLAAITLAQTMIAEAQGTAAAAREQTAAALAYVQGLGSVHAVASAGGFLAEAEQRLGEVVQGHGAAHEALGGWAVGIQGIS
jgi:hypothetical protein